MYYALWQAVKHFCDHMYPHKWDMCFCLVYVRKRVLARAHAHTHNHTHTHFLLSLFVSFNFVFFLGFQMSNKILGRNFGRCGGGGKGASKKEGIAQVTSKGDIKLCLGRETSNIWRKRSVRSTQLLVARSASASCRFPLSLSFLCVSNQLPAVRYSTTQT